MGRRLHLDIITLSGIFLFWYLLLKYLLNKKNLQAPKSLPHFAPAGWQKGFPRLHPLSLPLIGVTWHCRFIRFFALFRVRAASCGADSAGSGEACLVFEPTLQGDLKPTMWLMHSTIFYTMKHLLKTNQCVLHLSQYSWQQANAPLRKCPKPKQLKQAASLDDQPCQGRWQASTFAKTCAFDSLC